MSDQNLINVALTTDQWQAVLITIRLRQQDCQKVTPEFKNYQKFFDLDARLEALKMNVADQLPS